VSGIRFGLLVLGTDLACLALAVFLLRTTFNHRIRFGSKTFDLPKAVAILMLWLAITVPLTLCLWVVRQLVVG
jgi:TRAP-type C4-dicarboxylate transport system permease small subunit